MVFPPFGKQPNLFKINMQIGNVKGTHQSPEMSEMTGNAYCQTCGSETVYKCLTCSKAVCNRSTNCSIAAPEEILGWKPGSSVAFCSSCAAATGSLRDSTTSKHDESMNITPEENKGIKRKQKNDSYSASHGSDLKTKCNCLDLSGKVAVINCAEHFKTGRMQIQTVLKNKASILALHKSSDKRSQQKQQRTANYMYTDVKEAVWEWYKMCRKLNIHIAGTMLQEALIIAEKWQIKGFTTSNGWLEKFKKQHNVCSMIVTPEENNFRPNTVESRSEKA